MTGVFVTGIRRKRNTSLEVGSPSVFTSELNLCLRRLLAGGIFSSNVYQRESSATFDKVRIYLFMVKHMTSNTVCVNTADIVLNNTVFFCEAL